MGHFASLLIIMLLLLCNKGVLGYNEGETGPTDPTVSPTSRPSWLTSVRPIRSPQRTESPTLTPNGADSAAPSFAPSTKEKNRKTHPSDANEFPTDNLYYVYSGAVIVVAVATIYFCLRYVRIVAVFLSYCSFHLFSFSDRVATGCPLRTTALSVRLM